jgi:hypothetical protein
VATVVNQFDPDDPNNNNQQQQGQGQTPTLNAPTIGGPQGGAVATPGASGPTQSGTSSGRFNNLQKYIDANKDFNADQGGLAGAMVGNINNQAQTVQNNLQGAQNAFAQQSQQSIDSFNHPDAVNQALQDPTAFVQNPNNLNTFAGMRDAQYTGPKTLQDLSGDQNLAKLQTQSANVNDMVNQGQSESGRFNLLKSMFGNNNYTSGQQNLDNLLIQGQPEQMKQIQGARQIATNTASQLNQTEQNVENTAQQAQQQAQGIQDATRAQVNQAAQGATNEAQQKYQTATNQQNQDFTNLQGYLNNPKTFAQSGVDPDAIIKNSGINPDIVKYSQALQQAGYSPSDFLSKGAAPTEQNVLSQADYAKMNALNQLMGGSNGAIAATASPDVSAALQKYLGQESQAGGFNPSQELNYDNSRYSNAVSAAHDLYNQQVSPYTNQLQNLTGGINGLMPQAQQAVSDAQAAYNQQKSLYDMLGMSYDQPMAGTQGLPQNMSNQQLIDWYTKNNATIAGPTQGVGDHTTAPQLQNPYMGLLDQISSTGAQYKDTQGAINSVNNRYGDVFNQAPASSDPLAALMNYLGTAPGATPDTVSAPTNVGARI